LYLIHWPDAQVPGKSNREVRAETWRAMEELYEKGDTDSGCPDHNYVFLKCHADVNHSGVGNAMIPEQKVK
ncbi:hypothetical protein DV515_00004974, partial [Chloebia gouldiae]